MESVSWKILLNLDDVFSTPYLSRPDPSLPMNLKGMRTIPPFTAARSLLTPSATKNIPPRSKVGTPL
jgi:hypothetical protein